MYHSSVTNIIVSHAKATGEESLKLRATVIQKFRQEITDNPDILLKADLHLAEPGLTRIDYLVSRP